MYTVAADDEARRLELYLAGYTDEQIGQIVCLSANGVSAWRHRRGYLKERVLGFEAGWRVKDGIRQEMDG